MLWAKKSAVRICYSVTCDTKIGDQHLLIEKTLPAELNVPPKKIKDGLVYHNEAVQTDLTTELIARMEQAPFKQRRMKLKRDLLWRMCNEMIVEPGFTLA